MWRLSKLQFYIIQILNYSYFEITIFNRIKLFYNHIHNSVSSRQYNIEVAEISIHKAYVISLNYRQDRRKDVNCQFENIRMHFEFFDAFHLDNYNNLNKYFTNNSLKYLSHGALGCAYSHLQLIEHISIQNSKEYFLIFEDDVLFSAEFRTKFNDLLKYYPINADLFFLGSRNERKRDIKLKCKHSYNQTYNARLGAYAYMINANSARKIIELLKPIDLLCGGIDTAIGKLIRQNKITAYQFEKSIVFHNSKSPSNIFNPSAKSKKIHFRTKCNWPLQIDNP